jgi:tryptophan-rich sensory protein
MKRRLVHALAVLLAVVVVLMVAAASVLAAFNRYGDVSFLIAVASGAVVGGLIARRRRRSPIGWFILGNALSFATGEFSRQYAIYGLTTQPGALPWARALASPPYWVWFPGVLCLFALLPLYFPNGRLLSPRWRPVMWVTVGLISVMTTLAAMRPSNDETLGIPNPLGVPALAPVFETIPFLWPLLWLSLGVLAATSLVLRFRQARGEERQQIKWVVYAIVLLVVSTIAQQVLLIRIMPLAGPILLMLTLQAVWVAVAVAVFKYRLYDIDVLINRTLVYGALTATLALIYVGSVVGLQYVVQVFSGESRSQLATVGSTLAIVVLFQPLRRSIQTVIDRRFYRRRYNTQRTLDVWSAKMRGETNLDMLSTDLVQTVEETLQPSYVHLWLCEPTHAHKGQVR